MKRCVMLFGLMIFMTGCAGRNYQPWTQAFVVMQLACPPSSSVSLENDECKVLSQKLVKAEVNIRPEGTVEPSSSGGESSE